MNMTNSDKCSRTSKWPYVIISSFVLLALFDAWIVTVAIQSSTASVETNPYETGLAYEKVIEGRRAAKRENLSVQYTSNNGCVRIELKGLPQNTPLKGVLTMLRADRPSLDVKSAIQVSGEQLDYCPAKFSPGLWLTSLQLEGNGTVYNFGPDKVILSN